MWQSFPAWLGPSASVLAAIAATAAAVIAYRNVSHQVQAQLTMHRDLLAHQERQERYKDERVLRDTRSVRLRALYTDALDAAYTQSYIAARMQLIYKGETEEERNANLTKLLSESADKLNRALIGLELEAGARDVLDALQRSRRAFDQLRAMRSTNREHPGAIKWEAVREQETAMELQIERLRAGAAHHIATIEEPVPPYPPA